MSIHTLGFVVLVLVGVLAVVALALLAAAAYALRRFQVPNRGIVVALGALIYLISPIDLIPEAIFGPFGLIDDGGVLIAAAMYLTKLIADRRAAIAADDKLAEPGAERRHPAGDRHPDPRVVDSRVIDSHVVDSHDDQP